MSSPFFGFSIGVRALNVSQRALDIIGHNIANINTPGHSRQEAVLKTTDPQYLPSLNRAINSGQIGTGVKVEEVRRIYDGYIANQLRSELENQGKWQYSTNIIEQAMGVFSEPGESGLQSMVNTYWNSWRALESSPEDHSLRKNLVENTKSLCNFFKSIGLRLDQLTKDIDTEFKNKISEVNNYSSQIAKLNQLIKSSVVSGDNPNDLLDRRDVLIDQLSKIVNITARETEFGMVDVYVVGKTLVRDVRSYEVEASLNATTGYHDALWADDSSALTIRNGELFALQNFRDNYLNDLLNNMDTYVDQLIARTNVVHAAGFDLNGDGGVAFFSGSGGLKGIHVNPAIASDISLIAAAATTGVAGDNANIAAMLSLREELDPLLGNKSFDDYYNNLIIQLGVDSQQFRRESENTNLLIHKINLRKDAVSGISLDEELVNMVKFQHSYNAAARVINVMDEIIGHLIEKLGR